MKRINELPNYIYGTTRLGDESLPLADRLAIALEAMQKCTWFHASDQYGSALSILAEAIKQKPLSIPKMIFKLEAERIEDFRDVITRNIGPLGVDHMDIGQLCLRNRRPEDFVEGSKGFDEFSAIRQEGLVKQYIMEIFPWTSGVALKALKMGCMENLVDGFIFYFNPLQRFALNDLWDEIESRRIPVIAMRTVCGNDVLALRDVPGAAWKEYIQQRAVEIAPIFAQSGVEDWSAFCVRFAQSQPLVQATVGSTAHSQNLAKFLDAAKVRDPLPASVLNDINYLQKNWSAQFDYFAEPWSM